MQREKNGITFYYGLLTNAAPTYSPRGTTALEKWFQWSVANCVHVAARCNLHSLTLGLCGTGPSRRNFICYGAFLRSGRFCRSFWMLWLCNFYFLFNFCWGIRLLIFYLLAWFPFTLNLNYCYFKTKRPIWEFVRPLKILIMIQSNFNEQNEKLH